MSGPRWIHASHHEAEMARHLAEAQAASVEARVRYQEARRAAMQPPPPPPPPKPKPPAARPKPPTPRRAVSEPAPPPVPAGHVLVEADVLDALIATSSLTRKEGR